MCFGEDAAADAASAAMWQLTSANDGECVGNPMAHERGGCRVLDPKEHAAAAGGRPRVTRSFIYLRLVLSESTRHTMGGWPSTCHSFMRST